MVVDGVTTKYLNINKGVPQGTVLGPILFSIMINDLKPVFPTSLLVKYADDVTLSFPIRSKDISSNVAQLEVNSIMQWADNNNMKLNLSKTWELLLKGRTSQLPPIPLTMVERKQKLRLLGVTFEECPTNWNTQIDNLLKKAGSRLYILRVCKYYGYSTNHLDLLFHSLVLSVFTYAIEVWGCCYYDYDYDLAFI